MSVLMNKTNESYRKATEAGNTSLGNMKVTIDSLNTRVQWSFSADPYGIIQEDFFQRFQTGLAHLFFRLDDSVSKQLLFRT